MVRKRKNEERLKTVFLGLQAEMIAKLRSTRASLEHSTTKGNVTENSWRQLLSTYLPKRYSVESAFVIDSTGRISDQIDIVIFDRHFSPFLFHQEGALYVPAESVYGAFEIKQDANAANLKYAAKKIESIRRLKRTSASIPHAGGKYAPVVPKEILGGLLALTCSGKQTNIPRPLLTRLTKLPKQQRIDLLCVLERGAVSLSHSERAPVQIREFPSSLALVHFFLALLSSLQALGSVPAMDINAYWKALES